MLCTQEPVLIMLAWMQETILCDSVLDPGDHCQHRLLLIDQTYFATPKCCGDASDALLQASGSQGLAYWTELLRLTCLCLHFIFDDLIQDSWVQELAYWTH